MQMQYLDHNKCPEHAEYGGVLILEVQISKVPLYLTPIISNDYTSPVHTVTLELGPTTKLVY